MEQIAFAAQLSSNIGITPSSTDTKKLLAFIQERCQQAYTEGVHAGYHQALVERFNPPQEPSNPARTKWVQLT